MGESGVKNRNQWGPISVTVIHLFFKPNLLAPPLILPMKAKGKIFVVMKEKKEKKRKDGEAMIKFSMI